MIDISIKNTSRSDKESAEFVFALAGNPNVGKSTVFNRITGLKQHTGNWSGKTVSLATGEICCKDKSISVVDLPGSYSLFADSVEEQITRDYLIDGTYDCLIIIADATSLERNLSFVLQLLGVTNKAVLGLNFMDEVKKKGIEIDTDELSLQLGIPVVKLSARHNNGIEKLIETALDIAENRIRTFRISETYRAFKDVAISNEQKSERMAELSKNITDKCVGNKGTTYGSFDKKIDRLLLSPVSGIPLMLLLVAVVFWLTAFGANYPSELLTYVFGIIKGMLNRILIMLNTPDMVNSLIVDGIYTTVSWVVSVMLPPALIFFPLFALLEDSGILPRFAFILDRCFSKAGTNGKQALTMLMGFGCNVCGVMGCRIIKSQKERLCAVVTNSFIPCNGRLPALITLAGIFFYGAKGVFGSLKVAVILLALIVLAVFMTFLVSLIFNRVYNKSESSGCFILELPPYRRPQFIKTILLSLKDKALYVLSRAIMVSIPAGVIIWCLANIQINNVNLLGYVTSFLQRFAVMVGVDGVILAAILLSFPANEIFIPIVIMAYSASGIMMEYSSPEALGILLRDNGWTDLTALCVMILSMFHFPCFTTCASIKKETGSYLWTAISVIIPITIGLLLCFLINLFA